MIVHVTGARPNFPKAAPVLAALAELGIDQRLVHTGQHYDRQLSQVFFEQLGLPTPDANLNVGSGTHGDQTAAVMVGIEHYLVVHQPVSMVVVYGDVNSTVATSLVAAKLQIPVAHVEAGLRSFDRSMPEEINRIVTDRLSDLLFATSPEAIAHLSREGVPAERIHFVGNPMVDTLLSRIDRFKPELVKSELNIGDRYGVVTLHRPGNVDRPETAKRVVQNLHLLADLIPLVVPLHPRGRETLAACGLLEHPNILVCEPLGYIEFMSLVRGSQAVVTDSGGVQEESTMLGVPCFTLRPNTERPITIASGTNRLVTIEGLRRTVEQTLADWRSHDSPTPPLWDGHSGKRIARVLVEWLDQQRGAGLEVDRGKRVAALV